MADNDAEQFLDGLKIALQCAQRTSGRVQRVTRLQCMGYVLLQFPGGHITLAAVEFADNGDKPPYLIDFCHTEFFLRQR